MEGARRATAVAKSFDAFMVAGQGQRSCSRHLRHAKSLTLGLGKCAARSNKPCEEGGRGRIKCAARANAQHSSSRLSSCTPSTSERAEQSTRLVLLAIDGRYEEGRRPNTERVSGASWPCRSEARVGGGDAGIGCHSMADAGEALLAALDPLRKQRSSVSLQGVVELACARLEEMQDKMGGNSLFP